MRILFIHNNFPGQYKRIVEKLIGNKSYDMRSISLSTNKQPARIPRLGYELHRKPSPGIHPAVTYTEECVLTGQAALIAMLKIKKSGWNPDIVLSHSGWGPSLFLREAWPDTKHLSYFEWFYTGDSEDLVFTGVERDVNLRMRARMRSTAMLHDFASMDWGQSPTVYQATRFPKAFQERMTVLHDGVDVEFFSPREGATVKVGDRVFKQGDPLITYIARGMEPYRGFPEFIEAVSILQKTNPEAHVVVVGADRVAYGAKRPDGRTYKEAALADFQPDLERLHFVGTQPIEMLRDLLRVSAAHVYLTVPFVLSWSMLEAMSTGALLVCSDTAPVREVLTDGVNGVMVPFHEPATLAARLSEILRAPEAYVHLRQAARKAMVESYDSRELTDRYLRLIDDVAAGRKPVGAASEINHR